MNGELGRPMRVKKKEGENKIRRRHSKWGNDMSSVLGRIK